MRYKELHWWKCRVLWCLLWHFHWNWEFSQRTLQVPAQTKCKTHKTCTTESSQFICRKLSTRKSGIWNKLGILEPVSEIVTEWVNSFVIVEKKVPVDSSNTHSPGAFSVSRESCRICLDPRDLNESIGDGNHITHGALSRKYLENSMVWQRFTIADFNKGYWMVELHPGSRKLKTMALDTGRFQWTWLPMGSIFAQDVFQSKLNSIFLDMPGVTGIAEDMIIYGRDDQEHDGNLLNFLEVWRNNNLTLNAEKMQFRLPKVSFFGHTWSDKGISAGPKWKLKLWKGWKCLKMWEQWEVS